MRFMWSKNWIKKIFNGTRLSKKYKNWRYWWKFFSIFLISMTARYENKIVKYLMYSRLINNIIHCTVICVIIYPAYTMKLLTQLSNSWALSQTFYSISGALFYFIPPETPENQGFFVVSKGYKKWEHWPEMG